MKHTKKILSGLICFTLLFGCTPVFAKTDEENTPKEEVIYSNLNNDGTVNNITVVNSFDVDENGKIVDYGDYETVRNMTSTDKIDRSGDEITINATSKKIYYEGKLKSTEIPWNFDIKYYLDGEELPAEKLAGQSGHLKIAINISKNDEIESSFFDGYALQATLSLNSENCKNIETENATIANVGKNKQLSYIILPGKNTDISIEADVSDFEMDGISINGVKLNISFSVDDNDIQDKVDELTDAVKKLNDGAGDLNEGTSKLYDAVGTLKNKTGKLNDGVEQITSGAKSLTNGLSSLDKKSGSLVNGAYSAFKGLCEASTAAINAKLAENGINKIKLTPENYSSVLNNLLKKTNADTVYNQAYNEAKKQVTAAVKEQANSLYKGYIEQNSDAIISSYIDSQADSLYTEVAKQTVAKQLAQSGMSEEQVNAYLQTTEGLALIEQAKKAMTDEQKQQIISSAKATLTSEQKQQILNVALSSLTDKQKNEIQEKYIEQQMASEKVTNQISATVKSVSSAAGQISELKGKLDNYSVFYKGVKEYTSAVSSAKKGSSQLEKSLNTLFSNTEKLNTATVKLHSSVNELLNGTEKLKLGTQEFYDKTDGISDDINDEISSAIDEATGNDVKIESFVSSKNTNIKSVQFVIKTENIKKAEKETQTTDKKENLNIWQKFLRLFNLY